MDFIWRFFLVPLAQFLFEFMGDRPWLLVIVALLLIALIWKWGVPWVVGFYRLFGWQGVGLLAVAVLTLGAFGAGWRAHRASVVTGIDQDNPMFDLRPKPAPDVPDNPPFGDPVNTPKPRKPRAPKKPVAKK